MITQYELPYLLKQEIPKLGEENYPARITMDIYKSMQYFADYTGQAVSRHRLVLAKKCFHLADQLYRQGDSLVKSVVENIFIYSFSGFMPADKEEKKLITMLIPASLYRIYLKQVMGTGC